MTLCTPYSSSKVYSQSSSHILPSRILVSSLVWSLSSPRSSLVSLNFSRYVLKFLKPLLRPPTSHSHGASSPSCISTSPTLPQPLVSAGDGKFQFLLRVNFSIRNGEWRYCDWLHLGWVADCIWSERRGGVCTRVVTYRLCSRCLSCRPFLSGTWWRCFIMRKSDGLRFASESVTSSLFSNRHRASRLRRNYHFCKTFNHLKRVKKLRVVKVLLDCDPISKSRIAW